MWTTFWQRYAHSARTPRRPLRPRKPFRPTLEQLESRLAPSTFTVVNTNDAGAGSLRQAILDANSTAGADLINFEINAAGVQTIHLTSTDTLASALPAITDPVVIDGYTQPGASPNTLADGDNAVLRIVLDGSLLDPNGGAVFGLRIQTS